MNRRTYQRPRFQLEPLWIEICSLPFHPFRKASKQKIELIFMSNIFQFDRNFAKNILQIIDSTINSKAAKLALRNLSNIVDSTVRSPNWHFYIFNIWCWLHTIQQQFEVYAFARCSTVPLNSIFFFICEICLLLRRKGTKIIMPSTTANQHNFFLEKNRMESFKSWPFSDRQKCSIQKVIYYFFFWSRLS